MKNLRILTATILILLMVSMAAFGAAAFVNVGPTTEFGGDIGHESYPLGLKRMAIRNWQGQMIDLKVRYFGTF